MIDNLLKYMLDYSLIQLMVLYDIFHYFSVSYWLSLFVIIHMVWIRFEKVMLDIINMNWNMYNTSSKNFSMILKHNAISGKIYMLKYVVRLNV